MDNLLPKVSIVTITWKHELFIEDTLNSFLQQKYNGPIEIIIANDNSPDDSDKVIQNYLQKTNIPNNIEVKYIKHSKNKGMMGNFVWSLEKATGKYIAICEGDDFWIDDNKLSKQVKFLEENLDYIITFSQVKIMNNLTKEIKNIYPEFNQIKSFNQKEIAEKNFITTPTCLYRNQFSKLPIWFLECSIGDYPLYIYLTSLGKAYFDPYPAAVYRDEVGTFSTLSHYKKYINVKNTLDIIIQKGYFKNDVIVNLKKQINSLSFYIFLYSNKKNKLKDLIMKDVDYKNLSFNTRLKIFIKYLLN